MPSRMKSSGLRVNRELLRVKTNYFLQSGTQAPVDAYISIIAKDMGFNTVSIGWICTFSPITVFFLKPVLGSLADKYRKEKLILMCCLLVAGLAFFSIQWVPSLVFSPSSVHLNCAQRDLTLCSDTRPVGYLNNSLCKVSLKRENQGNINNSMGQEILTVNKSKAESSSSLDFFITGEYDSKKKCLEMKPVQASDLEDECRLEQDVQPLMVAVDCETLPDEQILTSSSFWLLLVLVVTGRTAMSTSFTLVDTICLELLGDKARYYGRQRMWVGIAWGPLLLTAGMIVDAWSKGKPLKDYTITYYMSLGFAILAILNALRIKVVATTKPKSILSDVSTVLKDPKICLYLAWCFINGCYLAVVSNFLFWFLEDLDASQGNANKEWMKTLEGLSALVQTWTGEVPMFFISGWVLKKVGHVNAMKFTLIGYSLRFFAYSILSNPWLILPVEVIHSVCYGLCYATMTTYAKTIALPGTECTVQSLVSVFYEGAGGSAGGLLMGYMVKAFGYRTSFAILSTSAAIFGVAHILMEYISNLPCAGLKSKQGVNVEAIIEKDNGEILITFKESGNETTT